jgi:hypothetical protein
MEEEDDDDEDEPVAKAAVARAPAQPQVMQAAVAVQPQQPMQQVRLMTHTRRNRKALPCDQLVVSPTTVVPCLTPGFPLARGLSGLAGRVSEVGLALARVACEPATLQRCGVTSPLAEPHHRHSRRPPAGRVTARGECVCGAWEGGGTILAYGLWRNRTWVLAPGRLPRSCPRVLASVPPSPLAVLAANTPARRLSHPAAKETLSTSPREREKHAPRQLRSLRSGELCARRKERNRTAACREEVTSTYAGRVAAGDTAAHAPRSLKLNVKAPPARHVSPKHPETDPLPLCVSP